MLIVLAAIFAPLISPQNPYDLAQLDIMDSTLPPGSRVGRPASTYWLGTDDQGRDMLSAILYGLRISPRSSASTSRVHRAGRSALAVGLVAAYAGGRIDALLMRIVDIQLSFPAILIALILLAVLGKGVDKVIVALVTVQWAYYARTVRGAALVERARNTSRPRAASRCRTPRIVFRHLLPNCLPPLIVVATVQVAARDRARGDAVLPRRSACRSPSRRSAC